MCKYCEEDWTMTPRVADVALLPGLRGEGSRGGVMTTVEERREVARRLRELDHSDLQESLICAYLDALGIKGYEDWIGIAHRLADLIEPSCDRDALLRLARYMEKDVAETEAHFSNVISTKSVSDYARRIR